MATIPAAAARLTRATLPSFLSSIDTFLFDCDGVLWTGATPVPGAGAAVDALRAAGKRVFLPRVLGPAPRDLALLAVDADELAAAAAGGAGSSGDGGNGDGDGGDGGAASPLEAQAQAHSHTQAHANAQARAQAQEAAALRLVALFPRSRFGAREPPPTVLCGPRAGAPRVSWEDAARSGEGEGEGDGGSGSGGRLLVVPGVAFDGQCRRLGHGKGYYDAFIARARALAAARGGGAGAGSSESLFCIGIALDEQMVGAGEGAGAGADAGRGAAAAGAEAAVPSGALDEVLDAVVSARLGVLRRPGPPPGPGPGPRPGPGPGPRPGPGPA